MFAGEAIKHTHEGRAVLHTVLRAAPVLDIACRRRENVVPQVHAVLDSMGVDFPMGLRDGRFAAATGKTFTGCGQYLAFGGSDLGPGWQPLGAGPLTMRTHGCISSQCRWLRTFADTLYGLASRKRRLIIGPPRKLYHNRGQGHPSNCTRIPSSQNLVKKRQLARILLPSPTALDRWRSSASDENASFGFWDWVGGRYSLWSAIRPCPDDRHSKENFAQFSCRRAEPLADTHSKTPSLARTCRMLLGLDRHMAPAGCVAIQAAPSFPYDKGLSPAFRGLSAAARQWNQTASPLDWIGKPLETGIRAHRLGRTRHQFGQHAFFQLRHREPDVIPVWKFFPQMIAANGHEPRFCAPASASDCQLPGAVRSP